MLIMFFKTFLDWRFQQNERKKLSSLFEMAEAGRRKKALLAEFYKVSSTSHC
jgi:hypothetical protein